MQYRILGRTGLEVSAIALGAGPVPGLMTGGDARMQRATVARALEVGINWFDTAPGYGDGASESNLGRALNPPHLPAPSPTQGRGGERQKLVHVATKVRLGPDDLADGEAAVRRSLAGSLARLGLPAVTLLQLHNGITARRGDVPASLTPDDVLRPGGVAEAFDRVRAEGLVRFAGLTGTGETEALSAVIDSGRFDTIQVPHHLLAPADGRLLRRCRERGVGVLAIRVFAGGALLGRPPSAHTLRTPYFPLALYEEERRRAALQAALEPGTTMQEQALRFVLGDPAVQVALLGLATPGEVDEAAALVGAASRAARGGAAGG